MAQSQAARRRARKKRREQRRAKRASDGIGANGQGKKPKGRLREWLDAVVFAVVVMLIVRTFFFDLFRIPTPSMEKSLLVGDYLFVSKLHYGTRTPHTLAIPFTQIYLRGVELPHTRFPGFSEVQRNDAIVFNWPVEDKPIDRKMHYIKRVVGLPGETLEVENKVVHIDGEPVPFKEGMQQFWDVYKKDQRVRLSESRLRALGIEEIRPTNNPNLIRMLATASAIEEVKSWPYIDRVEPFIVPPDAGYSAHMYPSGQGYTPDNYGPVWIPEEGETVTLTAENWPVYEPVIRRYEGHTTQQRDDGTFEIDGQAVTEYTFQQNYFFVMGDNRDNSEDSRFWGFVPMSHVVGKAILIYFSWDAETTLPRFDRIFSVIDLD